MKDLMRKPLINKIISCFLGGLLLISGMHVSALSQPVQAQTVDSLDRLFTIREIKVDERARRASEARRTALAKAEQEAYDKLLRKITQPAGRAQLPQLSAQEKQALISGIDVVEEQSSSRRYTATLNVRFEPANVSQFLAKYHVPHVLSTGRGIVVLHGHRDGFSEYLWRPNAATVQARASVDWLNRIRRYVFPRGEIRERLAVTYREVDEFDAVGTAQIAGFHNVQSVLMISSQWENDETGGGTLSYRFLSSDGGLADTGSIQVAGDNAQAIALVQMFEDVLEKIDTAWRDQLLVDTGTGGDMAVLVPTTSLDVLTTVKKRLDDVTLVQSFKILSVGLPLSEVSFHYTGREDQLVLALRYAGLTLDQYGNKKMLRLRDSDQSAPPTGG
jgi:vacuolar-type H+-ATPase subunit H